MGLIDFNTPVCPYHGRVFTEISVCGLKIKCCEDCTAPPRRSAKYNPHISNLKIRRNQADKDMIFKETWKNTKIVYDKIRFIKKPSHSQKMQQIKPNRFSRRPISK